MHSDRNFASRFFAGTLPDAAKRKIIARNLGISANNDFAMLEEIGGECAGAVTFVKTGDSLPVTDASYRALSIAELANILKELPRRPLMAGESGIRLSLAGTQDKIPVAILAGNMLLPLSNAPSSHIIKPSIAGYEGMVFNEAFCMKLAKAVRLPVAAVEVGKADDIDYLLVERYDRVHKIIGGRLQWERIHQEDFSQALGIIPEWKYQVEGGPSLKQCFDLVRSNSTLPAVDLRNLLRSVIFNFLIGNHDAHGKNFSLLRNIYNATLPTPLLGDASEIRLAPLYDLICTRVYPTLSKNMAMKIGRASRMEEADTIQFGRFADEIGFAKPLVKQLVVELAGTVSEKLDEVDVRHKIVDDIRKFIREHCHAVVKNFV
ncbi:MAG: type II toxin-antitoxin system HipA family toxin [Bacteroidota bacterium]